MPLGSVPESALHCASGINKPLTYLTTKLMTTRGRSRPGGASANAPERVVAFCHGIRGTTTRPSFGASSTVCAVWNPTFASHCDDVRHVIEVEAVPRRRRQTWDERADRDQRSPPVVGDEDGHERHGAEQGGGGPWGEGPVLRGVRQFGGLSSLHKRK